MDDLAGPHVKCVLYSVVYIERDYQAILQKERQVVVEEDITAAAFRGIKIIEFLAHLRCGLPIPSEWRDGNHPRGDFGYVPDNEHPTEYSRIPELDNIRVNLSVVGRMQQESIGLEKDKRQLQALGEIGKRLEEK